MDKLPILYTPRLILRNLQPEDAERMYVLLADEEIVENGLLFTYPVEAGRVEAYLERVQKDIEKDRLTWAICLREGGLLIGVLSLYINPKHHHAEIGYWMGKAYWNQGFTTEACRQVLVLGFEEIQLHRIFAEIFRGNDSSIRVMQKVGMQYEGILRQHLHHWRGDYRDLVVYGILRHEFIK